MGEGEKHKVGAAVAHISQSQLLILLLFGTFFIYLLAANRLHGINVYDEGLSLLGAQNVMGGMIPYRDFWTVYPPGNLYLDAALFQVFGSSVIVERVAGSIISFLTVVCIFFTTKYITDLKYAVTSSILVIAVVMLSGPPEQAELLALVACVFLFRLRTFDRTRNVLILGLITGLSFVFRLDTSLYLFIALSVILVLCNCSGTVSVSRPKGRLYKAVKVWGIYVSGILIIAVPALILILHVVPLQDLIEQLIVFPRSIYGAFRSLPPPSPFSASPLLRAFFYVPILVYTATVLWLGAQVVRRKTKLNEQAKPLFLLLFGVMLFIYGSVRIDIYHLAPTLVISVILFSWLIFSFIEHMRHTSKRRTIQVITPAVNLAYLFTIMLVVAILLSSTLTALNPVQQGLVALDVDRAHGIYVSADVARNLTDAIAFIQIHVPQNQTIFVGNMQHEQIFTNNVMFYYLAERASATKYYDLHPGVATTAAVQNHIINDITQRDTKYIVLWNSSTATSKEPNQSQYKSGVKNLDDFIRANFVQVKSYGDYTICVRNDVFANNPEYNTRITRNAL